MKPAEIIKQPKNSVEIIEKRTFGSKTFSLGEGKFRLVKTIGAVHYKENPKNETEQWKEIDLKPEDKGDRLVVDKAPYNLEILKDKIGVSYASKERGNVIITLKSIGSIPAEQLNISLRVEDNKIWWDNVLDSLDIYLSLRPAGIEFFKVIKTTEGLKEIEWEIEEDEQHNLGINKRHSGNDADGNQVRLEKEIKNERIIDGKKKYSLIERILPQVTEILDRKTRIKTWTDNIKYPLLIDVPDISESIVNENDDGYEYVDYSNWHYDKISLYVGGSLIYHHAGLRFQTIALPQGCTIDSANIKINCTLVQSGGTEYKLYGDDVDDAVVWGNASRPTQVTKTTAHTDGTIASTGAKTIAVTNIVQEIVNREGWGSGNDMRFGILSQVGDGNGKNEFTDYPTANYPVLEIDYTAGGAGTNMKINIGDTFKDVSEMKINIGDTWKDVAEVKVNVGDVWKTIFLFLLAITSIIFIL